MNIKLQKYIEHLFISKVRIKTLKYFVMNPDKQIHLRAAVREFQEEINAVRRELSRLEESKFVISELKGNRKYFKMNKSHILFNDLTSIFFKVYGLGADIVNNQNKIGTISYAFLTPVFTKNISVEGGQAVDLVVIGDVDMLTLESVIKDYQSANSKEVHYMVMRESEFALRKRRKDQMIIELLMQANVFLIGNNEDLIK